MGVETVSQVPETSVPVETQITERIVLTSPTYEWDHDAVFRRSARYYGPTSFSAPFNEGVKLSEDLNIGEDGRKHPANWPFGQPRRSRATIRAFRQDESNRESFMEHTI